MASYLGRAAYAMTWGLMAIPGAKTVVRTVAQPRVVGMEESLARSTEEHPNDQAWEGFDVHAGDGLPLDQIDVLPPCGWGWDNGAWVPFTPQHRSRDNDDDHQDHDGGQNQTDDNDNDTTNDDNDNANDDNTNDDNDNTNATQVVADTNDIVDPEEEGEDPFATETTEEITAPPPHPPSPMLTVLTFNVMIGMYDRFAKGVTQTEARHLAIVEYLGACNADIISLNEVEPPLLDALADSPAIQTQYVLSDTPEDPTTLGSNNHGVVLLIKRHLPLAGIYALKSTLATQRRNRVVHKEARPVLAAVLELPRGRLALVGAHLEARAPRYVQRRQQLRDVYRAVRLGGDPTDGGEDGEKRWICADQAVVLGDFNTHSEEENVMFEGPFQDVWSLLRPSASVDEGVTWDGVNNTVIQAMTLRCDRRQMRLDRVISSTPHPVASPLAIGVTAKNALPSSGWLDPGLNLSDHYALLTTFTL